MVNAGSSSLKLQLVDAHDRVAWQASLPAHGGRFDASAAREALAAAPAPLDAVGHRVVHGGSGRRGAASCDRQTIEDLRSLVELAPLHQPPAIEAIEISQAMFDAVPHYCCFDTAFHATLPPAASTYALPAAWRKRWGLRRFGFHGLSHAWVARRVPEMLGCDRETLRIVSCHLGAGSSTCAIARGRSVDTSMGFTPLAGLVMATRCGDLDPGLMMWLLQSGRVNVAELNEALQRHSGLRALAGTADMRLVLERLQTGDTDAELAFEVVVHRLRGTIAAMSAAMDGLDVLAFTGGVGEQAAVLRARVASGLKFLGVAIDGPRNGRAMGDCEISAAGAQVRSVVVSAREHLEIARQVRDLLQPQPDSRPRPRPAPAPPAAAPSPATAR